MVKTIPKKEMQKAEQMRGTKKGKQTESEKNITTKCENPYRERLRKAHSNNVRKMHPGIVQK
jgi:hypothetical protein